MSDPNYQGEIAPPPQPPRPTPAQRQLEADERYARQLAAHYQGAEGYEGYGSRSRGEPPLPQRRNDTGLKPNELYDDKEHSFFDGTQSFLHSGRSMTDLQQMISP